MTTQQANGDRVKWLRSQATDEQISAILDQRDRLFHEKAELQRRLVEMTAELIRLRQAQVQFTRGGGEFQGWSEAPEQLREDYRKEARAALSLEAEPEPLDWTIASAPPAEETAARAKGEKKLTVLVVDDNSIVLFMMEKYLERQGHTVLTAMNGLAAEKLALTRFPDLIFMDINLPIQDGLTVTRLVREHPKMRSVPIVAFSATDTEEVRAKAAAAGCNAFLKKPLDVGTIDAVLKELFA
jgi:CheY-like chemotaxis protein